MDLSEQELHRIREWFNSVQDLSPDYLEREDYKLQVRVLRALGRRVPHDVKRGAGIEVEE